MKTVEGDVIAKQLFEGQVFRGESKAKLVQIVEAARKGFDEAQTEDQLPFKGRKPKCFLCEPGSNIF